ncbi:helix-turn-helix transcriptional regulator [Streptomyces sp. NPDC048248]|uniref:helix-turn-helix transcriptional regulator n=1 Tax=Streptomyces sp. NPDC048248 TaxID=3365523 RepID=UPI003713BD18
MSAQISNSVRKHRRAAGLTQEALTERSGVSFTTVASNEQGKSARRASFARLAEALSVDTAEPFSGGAPEAVPDDVANPKHL